MRNIFLVLVCLISFSLAAVPVHAGKKKKETQSDEYYDNDLESLDDTSSTSWKQGTGKTEEDTSKDKKSKNKSKCEDGKSKDLDGVCK